jgi:hypothetical protein
MSVGPVQSSSPVIPQQDSTTSAPSRSNAQSDAAINSITSHLGNAALQAMAKPDFFQSLAADAPKLLLGLIPVVGPFINLVQIFSKVAEYSGTATPAQNASVIPNKAGIPQQPKKLKEEVDELRESGSERVGVEHTERGSFGDARNGGSGSLTARADAGVRGDAVATVGPDGARVAVGGRAEAGVAVSARGEIHGDAGRVAGEANAYARAYAEGKGEAQVGPAGLTARASAAAGAEAGADARVCAETAPIVKLGGYDLKAGADASGYAISGTGASCGAEATATFNPPEVVGQVGARAFAGARAGAQASLGTGPFKLDVGIDARAGAGVEYGLDFSFKDGKFNMKGFAGIAAAVGLGTNFNLSIDFNDLGAMVAGIFGQVAMDAPKGSPGQAAAAGIADFVKFATPFAAKAAEKSSNIDLLNGEGAPKTERSGSVKRDDPDLERLSQKERDAIQEADLKRGQQNLERDLKQFGSGSRSSLGSSLV